MRNEANGPPERQEKRIALASPGYPVALNLEGRTVLVVGLGKVGRRKIPALRAAGARVIGVDPVVPEPIDDVLAEIGIVRKPYHSRLLRGVSLVIAAGPRDVNRQVVDDARKRGIWVNSSSDPEEGDLTVPASWRSGTVVLAVSTSGASPALAAVLRDQAAAAIRPAAIGLAELMAALRPRVLSTLADPSARRRIFQGWADPQWLSLWEEQGPEAVREALLRLIARGLDQEALDQASSGDLAGKGGLINNACQATDTER